MLLAPALRWPREARRRGHSWVLGVLTVQGGITACTLQHELMGQESASRGVCEGLRNHFSTDEGRNSNSAITLGDPPH